MRKKEIMEQELRQNVNDAMKTMGHVQRKTQLLQITLHRRPRTSGTA